MTATGTITERVQRIAAARADRSADASVVKLALIDAEKLKAWAEAQTAALVAKLAAVDSFPEQSIADTSRCGLGRASKTKDRSDTLTDTPKLAGALERGAVTTGHVDAVTRGKKKLDDPAQQQELVDRVEGLIDRAAGDTVEQFSRRVDRVVKDIQRGDGEDRLVRQKKATRLRHWVDAEGMWNLKGRFDPESALGLSTLIDATSKRMVAGGVPEHCPTDPVERDQFIAAYALARLLKRSSRRSADGGDASPTDCGTADAGVDVKFVVVIDVDADPGNGPEITFPMPIEVPDRVLAELAGDRPDVDVVAVRNGVVLYAPGNLNLGRSTRLASPAQRSSLRAFYRCCAVPGCSIGFDRCLIHHIVWWRHGGRTDFDNLRRYKSDPRRSSDSAIGQ